MATAVKQGKKQVAKASSGNKPDDQGGSTGFLRAHKPGEGYATRLGSFVLGLIFIWFAGHHWYYNWEVVRDLVNFFGILEFTSDMPYREIVQIAGTAVLVLGGGLFCYNLVYCNPKTSEFLVKTDGELAKVTWPAVKPWFKPEAKVWGATYVVLVVMVILTVYIFGIDMLLNLMAQWAFYG